MSAEHLLAHYHRIADAPDAVPRLRRFILDLAVRGKLAEQDPDDEPASELLKRIAAEKVRLEVAGKIRKTGDLVTCESDEIPFDLETKWPWARFGLIADFSAGRTPARNEPSYWKPGCHSWVSIADIKDGGALNFTKESISKRAAEQVFKARPCKIGTIIMSFKLTIGKIARLGIPAFHNEAIVSVKPHLSDLDPWLFLTLPFFAGRVTAKDEIEGATLNRTSISNIPIPLPPLTEQRRIVAKVDELMELCDRLEAVRAKREATRDVLATASLAQLGDPDPAVFRQHATVFLDNLTPLTTRRDQIKALRQTILNFAVRGRLVAQDPDDESTIHFEGTIRAGDAAPFEVPSSWNWARLCTLGDITGGGTPTKARDDYWGGSIPWVSPKDMKVDYIRDTKLSITEAAIGSSAANIIQAGAVLFVVRGMILAHSFPVAVTRVPLAINQDMKALVLKDASMCDYLLLALKGMRAEMLANVQRSSHGTCRIEGKHYKNFMVPVPPVAEQRRIAAKVAELFGICDELEECLATSAETRRKLVDTLLCQALEPLPVSPVVNQSTARL